MFEFASAQAIKDAQLDSKAILRRLGTSPITTNNWRDVKNAMQPADILAVKMFSMYYPSSTFFSRLFVRFRLTIEQSSYNSLKMCYDKKTIAGYCVRVKHRDFDKTVSDYFLSRIDGVVLLRHKKMNKSRQKLIIDQTDEVYKNPYGMDYLLEKAIHRVVGDVDPTGDKSYPMYCSAIIAKLYEDAGIHVGPKTLPSSYIWPSDYILDKNFDVVMMYDKLL